MKSLPVLTVRDGDNEMIYCQSGAIARYLAKKFGESLVTYLLLCETTTTTTKQSLCNKLTRNVRRLTFWHV